MTDENAGDEFTIEDVIYWMGWHMDSQRRVYDVLLSILAGVSSSDKAKRLQELHAQGKFLYPPAYMHNPEGDNDDVQ